MTGRLHQPARLAGPVVDDRFDGGELVLEGPVVGELLADPESFPARAAEIAAQQAAPHTRRTYAGVYRAYVDWLGDRASAPDALVPARVRAYRDMLERQGRSPATIAKHLSALRTLAGALGVAGVGDVRAGAVAPNTPRPLTAQQYQRLLRMPDRRTKIGKRDLALLHLLGSVGLRRSEASALEIADIEERQRAPDGRLRRAIAGSTAWWLTVRYAKRGRTRQIPLEQDALDAIVAWFKSRPTCDTDRLLVSLPRTNRPPGPLNTNEIGRIVTGYADKAGLPEDRRSPHVLRHTFCTHLADAGVPIEVIAQLAGHADLRTTSIYTQINPGRLTDAIDSAAEQRRGLAALTKR